MNIHKQYGVYFVSQRPRIISNSIHFLVFFNVWTGDLPILKQMTYQWATLLPLPYGNIPHLYYDVIQVTWQHFWMSFIENGNNFFLIIKVTYSRIFAAWWRPWVLAKAKFRWQSTWGCSPTTPCRRDGIVQCPGTSSIKSMSIVIKLSSGEICVSNFIPPCEWG